MWDAMDGKAQDEAKMRARIRSAVAEIVAKQAEVGVDIVSDGEMSKIGFSNYVVQRYSGFGAPATFVATDLTEFPDIATRLFANEAGDHMPQKVVEGPIELRDTDAVQRDIDNLKTALQGRDPDDAFITAISPGQMLFYFPNRYYRTSEEYLEAAARALAFEYRAIIAAGFNLQLDAPDLPMCSHSFADDKGPRSLGDHVPAAIEAMNEAIRGLPPEKIRVHLCWGNYAGPHHHDVELKDLIEPVLRTRAGFLSVEAANPRHEHEWEVWLDTKLPEGKALIPGVIDTVTNHVEHPRLVAQRIERFANIVGKENVIAGTDCGFSSFVGVSGCDPNVAWLKLKSLSEGAAIASDRLWP